jgi:hypothetical protein
MDIDILDASNLAAVNKIIEQNIFELAYTLIVTAAFDLQMCSWKKKNKTI